MFILVGSNTLSARIARSPAQTFASACRLELLTTLHAVSCASTAYGAPHERPGDGRDARRAPGRPRRSGGPLRAGNGPQQDAGCAPRCPARGVASRVHDSRGLPPRGGPGAVRGSTLPRGRAPTPGELRAFFAAVAGDARPATRARDAALLAVLYGAGVRRAVAVALDVADYDPETATPRRELTPLKRRLPARATRSGTADRRGQKPRPDTPQSTHRAGRGR